VLLVRASPKWSLDSTIDVKGLPLPLDVTVGSLGCSPPRLGVNSWLPRAPHWIRWSLRGGPAAASTRGGRSEAHRFVDGSVCVSCWVRLPYTLVVHDMRLVEVGYS